MPHPYEIVLNFRSKVPKHKQPQRSRLGCFNCRKLKKKCSEERPVCQACHQKCLPCVWPVDKEPLPKDYKIPPRNAELMRERRVRSTTTKRELRPKTSSAPVPINELQTIPDVKKPQPSKEDTIGGNNFMPLDIHSAGRIQALDDHMAMEDMQDIEDDTAVDWLELHKVTTDPSVEDYQESIPLLAPIVTSRSETFITACAVGLISALAPQLTHPLLHASSTWTPFVKMNPVMERVAEACGCSFMAWKIPDLAPLAEKKYDAAFTELFGYLSTHPSDKKDNLWLGAAFQLLAVGSKTVWTFRDQRRIDNLRGSWGLIKGRILSNLQEEEAQYRHFISGATIVSSALSPPSSSSSTSTSQSPPSPPPTIFDDSIVSSDYGNDNLKMALENALLHNEYRDDHASRFEKGWLEAFIYQYGMLLLIDDVDSLGLPNPFEVFTLVRKTIKKPLMNCDIAWMNHPVFGASYDAFEMACKASYLMRHLNHPMTPIAAQRLHEVVHSYQLPTIPTNVNHNSPNYTHLRDSSLMSEVMIRAVKILLRKVINTQLYHTEPVVQRDLDAALHKWKQMTQFGQVKGIGSWPLLILGLTCITQEQKDIIIQGCFQYAEVCQSRYIFTLIDTLETAWGVKGDTETTSRGLDILLERHILDKLIL